MPGSRRPAVLVCPPEYFTVRDVKNPFMDVENPVDEILAGLQWQALCDAFREAGVETLEIEPVADLEDMVFTANQTFVSGTGPKPFIVPSRMRHESREREVPYFVEWFRGRGFEIREVDLSGEYLEGHGDLLWHPVGKRVWAGHGFRSTLGGVRRFAAAMESEGIVVTPLQLVDERFYHLDTCFAPLTAQAALIYPGAFDKTALAELAAAFPRLYEVSELEALTFVCNGVVTVDHYIATHVYDGVRAALAREGLEPLLVDLSEFEKAGGSAFCLKTFVR
jgi:N-dimethylarginine dimethylaminohydrolase